MTIAVPGFATAPALQDGFNGPDLRWRQLETEIPLRIDAHHHVVDSDRGRDQVEQFHVSLAGGSSVQFAYTIGRAPVLRESRATLWVKSNRPGIQLAAQVVLPRSVHPSSGAPMTVLVRGSRYEAVGMWQQLELINLPTEVKSQSRVLRLELNTSVDYRQAFVTDVVLAVPGGPGGTTVRTDDLVFDGVLMNSNQAISGAGQRGADVLAAGDGGGEGPTGRENVSPSGVARLTTSAPRIGLHGPILKVEDRPFFPRVIEHRGESIELLAQLGFNTVLLSRLPTAEDERKAEQLDLWYVCYPPSAEQLATKQVGDAAQYARVLAWLLPDEESRFAPGQLRHRVESIHQWDAERNRPLVSTPGVSPEVSHRLVDVVLLGRFMRGRHAELPRHADWLRQQESLAGPGGPRWMQISMSAESPTAREAAHPHTVSEIDERLLEPLARIAVTNNCTGLLVRHRGSLEDENLATKRRALALALMNMKLSLIEPWLTGGKVIGRATSPHPGVSAVVMQVERARLVVPIEWTSPPTSEEATARLQQILVVPGVPESNQAFLLTPGSVTTLDKQRVSGGIRVSLDPDIEGFVLLTEDPRVIAALRRETDHLAGQAARLQKDLAAARLAAASRLGTFADETEPDARARSQLLAQASTLVSRSHSLLSQGKAGASFVQATAASRLVDQYVAQVIDLADVKQGLCYYGVTPALDTASDYLQLNRTATNGPFHANQLYGGDFEDLHRLMQFGWRHVSHQAPDVRSQVQLASQQPYHGKYCLVLNVEPADPERPPPVLLQTPLEIISPPIHVAAGKLMEVSGFVRIDRPIVGHADGLEIDDSLAGPGQSLCVQQTDGWQPFRIVRRIHDEGDLHLRLALRGMGTARLDALMVREIDAAERRPLTSVELRPLPPTAAPSPSAEVRRPRPLFDQPRLQ